MAGPTERDASSRSDPYDLCGVTIGGKYRVLSLIGSGGFGVVYRGVHTGFDEPIAVKCLRLAEDLDEAARDELLARLREEGRVLHRLSKLSSGIVQALDVGAVETPNGKWVPYLVLEWLEGETLGQYLEGRLKGGKGALSLEQALELLEPAARALDVAHKQKVAHRDVKPENLYLTETNGQKSLKVLDFGIAKVLTQHSTFTAAPAATQKAPSAFTPRYGAPEQFNKKRGATGPWTDVFALALILVEAVSGERALEGDDATQLYIAAADPGSRPTLRFHGVEASDAVEKVLARALAVEPADRYQSAGAFWDALREAAGSKARIDPAATDVSETGEFVSRHDIALAPTVLSSRQTPTPSPQAAGEPEPPLPPTKREGASDAPSTPAAPPGRSSAEPPAKSERPRSERPASAEAPSKWSERPSSRTPAPALDTDTVQPKPASSRWLPVVVVLALAGAALLYVQLMGIGPASVEDPPRDPRIAPSGPTQRAVDRPSPSANEGGSSGAGGAELDAGTDADADAPIEPPEGMVLIPLPADSEAKGFFLDITEVTTADYQECVEAGTCTPANRIVLTVEAARALGGVDPELAATPEQLIHAWEPRCNSKRKAGDHPVNCLKHGYAEEYCRFRKKRLPTSREWSIAAGEKARRFPWGDQQPECATACYGLNGTCVGSAREVASCVAGSRSADRTPEGVLDLAGNLAEWVSDTAPKGDGDGPAWRVVRGGSFTDEAELLGSGTTRALPPSSAYVSVGFRCALDLPAAASAEP